MPPQPPVTRTSLVVMGLRRMEDPNARFCDVADYLIRELADRLSEEDLRELAAYGLARRLIESYAQKRAEATPSPPPTNRIYGTPSSSSHSSSSQKTVTLLPSHQDRIERLHDLADELTGKLCKKDNCRRKGQSIPSPYVIGYISRNRFQCACTRLSINEHTGLNLELEEIRRRVRPRLDEKQKQAQQEEEDARRWSDIHDLMRCTNVTCRERRYPSDPLRHCARKWFEGEYQRGGWEAAEAKAREWGTRNQEEEDRYHAKIRFYFDLAKADGYHSALEDLRSIQLFVDGQMKPLIEFSLADTRYWESYAAEQANSWEQRRTWFGAASNALVENDCATIINLPAETLRHLGHLARMTWKEGGRDAVTT